MDHASFFPEATLIIEIGVYIVHYSTALVSIGDRARGMGVRTGSRFISLGEGQGISFVLHALFYAIIL